jgi:predicted acetyltransferase
MPFRLQTRLPFWGNPKSFKFLDPGPLVDEELELIPPTRDLADAFLASCRHPTTLQQSPDLAEMTRRQILDFVAACPNGRQEADPACGSLPCYHFWMRLRDHPELPIAGGIGLRIGNSYETVMYYGHVGYHVYPHARGHNYARRACQLLFPLASRHGLSPLWITCNPDNIASRRTCEKLGGQLVEIVPVPFEHALYQRGDKEKCRFRVDLP